MLQLLYNGPSPRHRISSFMHVYRLTFSRHSYHGKHIANTSNETRHKLIRYHFQSVHELYTYKIPKKYALAIKKHIKCAPT